MGCGAGQKCSRPDGDGNLELLQVNLVGLSTGQLQALEDSPESPSSLTTRARQARLVREPADVESVCSYHPADPDCRQSPRSQASTTEGGDSPALGVRVHSPHSVPAGDSPFPSSPSNCTGLSFPGSPKSACSGATTSSGISTNFDAEGRKLIAAIGTSAVPVYNEADAIWEHPTTGARLYVGSEGLAQSREKLQALGVTCIVRCLDLDGTPGAFEGDSSFEYLHFPISWWKRTGQCHSHKGIARILAPLLGFVAKSLEDSRSVLVHCLAGAHRAGTAGTVCLMHLCQLDDTSALCVARAARPCIDPIGHLGPLLRRLRRAQLAGEVGPAIDAAALKGFQAAALKIFGKV
mmetsp:Transcript_70958/g.229733  ORF Transcript_70958/g.229733 Transcript_70958/m.229733 type:complete len:350 (+) Transcript_70958:28-1077(+)